MSSDKKNRILVTGGAGFIGSHLCEALALQDNYEVVSLDNYSTGDVRNHVKGVTYINGNTKDISKLISFSPDLVYHLGEYSRVEQSFDDIGTVWEYNQAGTFAVLEFCHRHKSKICYAGSSTKFGDGGLGRSDTPYGWSKASNTELVKNYGSWFDLEYAITYFYNAYGPREISHGKYATVVGIFHDLARRKQPISVVYPGNQTRNFTHVNDIISGLLLVGKHGHGDEYGIGSSEAFTILELAEMFDTQIRMLPARRGNRMTAEVITEKTKALGWKAEHSLVEYVQQLKEKL